MATFLRAESIRLELPLNIQRVDGDPYATQFKTALGGTVRRYRDVLKDISFSAEQGDRIGIVGLNGSGKTTLLRVLNGAFPPTQGQVRHSGSMQSLLNATLGFAEYASVSENVILRGTAMGLRRRQLQAVLRDVLQFSGLADRALHRLHTLSSGQRMRLGFAISTAIQPDILVMDEWLATGDAAFVHRAQERMADRVHGSGIVVIASHNTGLIRKLCSRVVVLHEGRAKFVGDTEAALECYRDIVSLASAEMRAQLAHHDPLLFGDAVGVVDRVARVGGGLQIEGWAVGDKGNEVRTVRVDVGGVSYVFDTFQKKNRDDVNRYMGKRGDFGFVVDVPLAADAVVTPLQERVTVSVGASGEKLGAPLRYAIAGTFNV